MEVLVGQHSFSLQFYSWLHVIPVDVKPISTLTLSLFENRKSRVVDCISHSGPCAVDVTATAIDVEKFLLEGVSKKFNFLSAMNATGVDTGKTFGP